MVKIYISFKDDTPIFLKENIKEYIKSLDIVFDDKENWYTITNPNDMSISLAIIGYIRQNNLMNYIEEWFEYSPMSDDEIDNDFDEADYKYTFPDSDKKFAKEDCKEIYIKYHQ